MLLHFNFSLKFIDALFVWLYARVCMNALVTTLIVIQVHVGIIINTCN